MEILLDIPVVMMLAAWVWGEDPLVTPDFCVRHLPVMNGECWSRLIAKGLGVGIIAGACLNKAPIMLNIFNAKSTAGLSRQSIYLEVLLKLNSFLYGYLQNHPITSYGENLALLAQNTIIAILCWFYTTNPSVSLQEKASLVVVGAAYLVAVLTALPNEHYHWLMTSTLPLMLIARGSQIYETFRNQHTGTQSIITTSLDLVGATIRIFTTIKEVGFDLAVLSGYAISVMLSVTIFIQYLLYRKNTEQFLRKLQTEKDRKKEA